MWTVVIINFWARIRKVLLQDQKTNIFLHICCFLATSPKFLIASGNRKITQLNKYVNIKILQWTRVELLMTHRKIIICPSR